MSTNLLPDPRAAIAFLELMRPGGPWILTAITPDGPTTTETFTKATTVAAWIERQNTRRNIYWMPAEAVGTLRKKATKEEVAKSFFLWADLDGVFDISHLNGQVPPPTTVVESGGGFNLYWALSEPIDDRDDIAARNKWIEKQLNADECHNCDRILRVPGTVNWPGKTKKAKGRVPVLARLAEHHPDRILDFDDFGRVEHSYHPKSDQPDAAGDDILQATDLEAFAAAIPNADRDWAGWNHVGMAFHAASGGSKTGLDAFDDWSRKSSKYDGDDVAARWDHYFSSPPTQVNAGTLVYLAKQAQPDFRRPSLGPDPRVDTHWEEADPHASGHGRGKAKPNGHDDEDHTAETASPKDDGPILNIDQPYQSAAVFLERQHSHPNGPTLWRYRTGFYAWTGTHYVETKPEAIRNCAYTFLDRARALRVPKGKRKPQLGPFKPNARNVSDLVDALRARTFLADEIEMPAWLGDKPGPAVIPLKNGLLDPDTGVLCPNTPRYFQSYSLPFAYDPAAAEPAAWLAFLRSIWPDDAAARDTLQEIIGLLLTADTSHQKLFLMVGPPRSGRGTIARVIQELLGRINVAGPTLSDLAQNFGLQELIGKPAAVVADARLSGRADAAVIAERLLSISGEDRLTVDRKHRDPWTGTLPTRIILLTNVLPRIADVSGALATRFVILIFKHSFLGREDHALTRKLLAELPGIFNWALIGRARLAKRGRFEMPQSSIEAVDELSRLTSPMLAFLEEKCSKAPAATVACGDLFNAWQNWCKSQGNDRPGTRQSFGVGLRSVMPELVTKTPHRGDRFYLGLRLRTDDDANQ